MFKPNSVAVFNYIKTNDGNRFTAEDIAAALSLSPRSVNGSITRGFCGHKDADGNPLPLVERVPATVTMPDGTEKTINLIQLTDAGRAFSINQ